MAVVVLAGCSGGGGGGGGGDDGEFIGASGVGANGVTVFWWRYGGIDYGTGSAAVEAGGGAFVAAGQRSRAGDSFDPATYDICLSKLGSRGEVIWERGFGDPARWDYAEDVEPTSDGGFILTGATMNAAGNLDCFVVKTDGSGILEWTRTLGDGWLDEGRSVCETANGYAVVGTRTHNTLSGPNADAALIRLGFDGDVISETLLGGSSLDSFLDVRSTAAGGLVLAGVLDDAYGSPGRTIWLLEFDAAGALRWQRTFGTGRATSVAEVPGGGFVATGSVVDGGGKTDCLLLALDANGNESWRRSYGGPDDDGGESICVAASGDILIAGTTQSFTSGAASWERQDMYLARFAPGGALRWQKVKGRWPTSSESAASIRETADGGLLVCGGGSAHMVVMKADANGDSVKLGDLDVSLTIPDVPAGTIDVYNQVEVAKHAVLSLMTPRGIGPFATDMAARVLSGDTPLEICDQGGTMSVAPPMLPPLSAGQQFAFSFANCASNPSNPLTLSGTYQMIVDAASGSPTAPPYSLTTRLSLDLGVTDDVGMTYFDGGVVFDRDHPSATNFVDATDLIPGSTLFLQRPYRSSLVTALSLASTRAGSTYTLGPAHVVAHSSYIGESLVIDVLAGQELRGPIEDSPSAGSMTISAQDSSSLRIRAVGNGAVELDLDTNGDGTIDLTRRMTWEDLE